MTEVEWRTATDPHQLIDLLGPDVSRRKLRHFVCACVRHQLPPATAARAARVLAFAERLADDEASIDAEAWAGVQRELDDLGGGGLGSKDRFGHMGLLQLTVDDDIYTEAHWAVECLKDADVEAAVPLGLLREIFGNPFQPIDPTLWRTGTALTLARQMYQEQDFCTMCILADALQDAGCDDADVLDHCRGPRPHVRGCWVVDLVLGKR